MGRVMIHPAWFILGNDAMKRTVDRFLIFFIFIIGGISVYFFGPFHSSLINAAENAQNRDLSSEQQEQLEQLRALGYVGDIHDEAAPRQKEAEYTPVLWEPGSTQDFDFDSRPTFDLFSEMDGLEKIEIAGRTRITLPILAGESISFQGRVPDRASLILGAGQIFSQIKPNTLILQIDLFNSDSQWIQQEIVSTIAGAWIDRTLDLHSFSGQEIRLVFSVLSLDPSQDRNPVYLSPLLLTHPSKDKTAPNVFFILVDTLRADALGCYGQADPVTPFLDQLAREGCLAERMIAQAPHTETSIPSIVQGLYPHVHGIMFRHSRRNSAAPEYVGSRSLREDTKTIAERFQQAGYLTYGFYNNILISAKFGFHRGFYEYVDYAAASGMTDPWGRIALPTAHLGTAEAMDVIERSPKGIPLFLFLHILDPHNPYTPPNEFNLCVKRDAKRIDESAYLSEAAYVDREIQKLVLALKENGLYENSIIAVTSDHGEEFVNPLGRPIGHGRTLFQTLLHVPFLCVYPNHISPGGRIVRMLESVDIAPTMAELAGLPDEKPGSGRSFVSFLLPGKGAAYSKTEAIAEGIRKGEERKCLIQDGHKLVYYCDSNRLALYDLENDPGELTDIAANNSSLVESMKKRLFERFSIVEPTIRSLEVANYGQDGWDVTHTFDDGSSFWQPGVSDIHLRVNPVPKTIQRIDVWADDRLHGNRNYSCGWQWPPSGEMPVAWEKENNHLDLFFDITEALRDSKIFVRLMDDRNTVYLGSFQGQNMKGPSRAVKTKDPILARWDFESKDALQTWRVGRNGSIDLFTIEANITDTFLQFESAADSGSFRVFHIIPKIPAGRRVLVSFDLVLESGGVRVELINPKTTHLVGSHIFSMDQEGEGIQRIPAKKIKLNGITGRTENEGELLFLISNYSPDGTPTRAFFNNIITTLYPTELESSELQSNKDAFHDLGM